MSQHSNGNIMRQGRHWKKLQPSSFLCADCGLMLTSAKECKEHIVEYHLAPSQNSNRLMSQSRDSSDQLASTNDVKECARYIQLEQPFTGENHFQQHINAGLVAAEEQLPPVFALLCTICNEKLPDKTSLLFHMSSSHNKKLMYECSMCLKMFSHRLDLRRHLDTHRPQVQSLADNNLSCPFCPKQFRFQCTYDRHVATHTGVKFYVCKICFEEFRSQGCLVTHMSEHTGQSNWVCQKCGKNFAYQSYLERHLKTHITSPMTCPHCNDLFLIKAELEAHILKEHMDGGHIKCPQCDKTFLYTCYLERHLVTHTNSRDHFCPVCGKTFSLRNHVLSHLKTHLPAEKMSPVEEAASKKKYQCRLCPTPKFYRFESRLQRHLREVHAHTSKVICITSAGNMTIPEVVIN